MSVVNNSTSYLSKVGFSLKEKIAFFFSRYGTVGVSLLVLLYLPKTCINLVRIGHDESMKFLSFFSVLLETFKGIPRETKLTV